MDGVIVRGIGGFYTVMDETGEAYMLRAQAKLRRARITPLVGDHVTFEPGKGEENGWLVSVYPRANSLIRPPVANIDVIVVVVTPSFPEPDLGMADKMLMVASIAKIPPILVVNKSDIGEEAAGDIAAQYTGAQLNGIFTTCAARSEGIDALKEALRGKIHAFGGQSGVGKSTLINALYGFTLQTGGLSDRIERGKHTTRHAELIPVDGGGMVLDTPGFSLLEMELIKPGEMAALYPEFWPYEGMCRFSPCMHAAEPDCAVREAVDGGKINAKRYERYVEHFREMNMRWRERYD